MGNYNKTVLTSNNSAKFNEIMKGISFKMSEVHLENGTAFIETRNSAPHDEITELSKKYPEMVFTAKYSFEDNSWTEIWTWNYENGISKEIGLEVAYSTPVCEHYQKIMGESFEKLLEEAYNFFKRVDIIREDKDKGFYVDYAPGIVCYTIEDNYYQMQVSKQYSQIIEIKCLKKVIEKNVKLISVDDDFPF